jgi:CheY-like chemotaxis protein
MDKKIFLLADDDSDDTEMFCEALTAIDKTFDCRCVENGREVLETLGMLDEMPSLIFLDINMPLLNGWQCLKQLKEAERYRQIPVVIYSTSSHQREIDIAMELGALCFLTKPSDFGELKEMLRVIINNLGPDLSKAIGGFCKGQSRAVLTDFEGN